jgi:hypothetical protein
MHKTSLFEPAKYQPSSTKHDRVRGQGLGSIPACYFAQVTDNVINSHTSLFHPMHANRKQIHTRVHAHTHTYTHTHTQTHIPAMAIMMSSVSVMVCCAPRAIPSSTECTHSAPASSTCEPMGHAGHITSTPEVNKYMAICQDIIIATVKLHNNAMIRAIRSAEDPHMYTIRHVHFGGISHTHTHTHTHTYMHPPW